MMAPSFLPNSSAAPTPSLIAVCQMSCGADLEANWKVAEGFIRRAAGRKCKMIFFPECFDFVGENLRNRKYLALEESDEFITRFREAAKAHKMWMSLGGFHRKDPKALMIPWKTHLVIDDEGMTQARYDKLHHFNRENLIDEEYEDLVLEREGSQLVCTMVPPVSTPIGNVGLSISYDLRFPELSLWNRKRGAHILTFPSGFSMTTGQAHWETLLRARAIDTQCYVVAAAQTGTHNPKKTSYGHTMVVDPWGTVIAHCSKGPSMCFAEIDLAFVEKTRTENPILFQRRDDLYALHVNEWHPIDQSELTFGSTVIPQNQIFARTAHAFAFVNSEPLLEGHVLVAPIRAEKNMSLLTDEEIADVFCLAKRVQRMLHSKHQVDSSTICVNDGPQVGQLIAHTHAHVLPRRTGGDGDCTNAVYNELTSNDRIDDIQRTEDDMASEAATYREAMETAKSDHCTIL